MYVSLLDKSDKLTGLFLCHKDSQKLLRANPEILIIDSIYRTNRFNMPFFKIIGVDYI